MSGRMAMAGLGVRDVQSVAGIGWEVSGVTVVVPSVGVFPRAMRRQGSWQRCVVYVGRQVMQVKGRQGKVGRLGHRFAAVSRNEAVEGAQFGNSGEEGVAAVRGEEGLVSTVGTPAPAPASFRDWYLADKQLVVISFTAFVVCFCCHLRNSYGPDKIYLRTRR